MPQQTQITRHDCVEGWSVIGKWSGVRLGGLLDAVCLRPDARYVVFRCMDNDGSGNLYYESLDLHQARHPQALLGLRLNDAPLDPDHGAPVRLRVPTQLGLQERKVDRAHRSRREFCYHRRRTRRLLGRPGLRMVRGDLRRACIAACAVVIALTAASPAEPVAYGATGKASLDGFLSDVVTWKLTPSISLAIVENGKVVYAGARGSADLEKNVPATTQTRYPIGSIGSLFLAVAVMQLAAKANSSSTIGRTLFSRSAGLERDGAPTALAS